MTYVVNQNCIKCKYTDCVEVCPVDCFYEGENMLVIHPDECIDCGVCEPECPVEAIVPDTKGVPPRYAEKSFSNSAPGAFHLVASKTGRNDSIAIHQDADLWLAKLEPGQNLSHTLAPTRHAWLHLAEGELTLNGHTLHSGDSAALSAESTLTLAAAQKSQLILFDLA